VIEHFLDDDKGFAAWLKSHPRGFVVNSDRVPTDRYLWLHRVRCLSREPPRTSDYQRTCADTVDELLDWAYENVGFEPTHCENCHP
jgi:hypothetical protein